ncbi:MAG: endonuclease V [Candidatus Aminicenantes bacterium]|nr:endonuclease V [Candidatus Aminicenantes bacterium]
MKLEQLLYPGNVDRARQVQVQLLKKLKLVPLRKQPRFLAAVDAAFTDELVLAAVCLFSFPELELLEEQTGVEPVKFPYIPGFLSFREGPAIYRTLLKLGRKPDLLLIDGQGIAHPRRLGIATFLGIILKTPSVGCAKSHLVGDFRMPARSAGSYSELTHRGELVGYVLRSRTAVRPIFISPGHLVHHQDALNLVRCCLKGYRVPEPLRRAHQLTQKLKRAQK